MPIDPTYNTVPERLAEFREKYPQGSLQPVDPSCAYKVEVIGEKTFIVYAAAAYRTPDDTRPGIGLAWEQFPGPTNFTRDSELQNAETSAWGRAIVAVLAADTKKGIATAGEIEARQAEQAHVARIKRVQARVKSAHAEDQVKARNYAWPWSPETCDEIEAFLDGEASAA